MAAAGVSPEEAASNLPAWADKLGIDRITTFLTSQSASHRGMTIGAILAVIGVLSLFLKDKPIKSQSSLIGKNILPILNPGLVIKSKRRSVVSYQESTAFLPKIICEFSNFKNYNKPGVSIGFLLHNPRNPIDYIRLKKLELRERINSFYEFRISNHGDSDIYNLEIKLTADIYGDDAEIGNRGKGFEKTTDVDIAAGKIKRGKSIVFWALNLTEKPIHLKLPEYVIGETHSTGRTLISYIHESEDGTPLMLSHIVLDGTAALSESESKQQIGSKNNLI